MILPCLKKGWNPPKPLNFKLKTMAETAKIILFNTTTPIHSSNYYK